MDFDQDNSIGHLITAKPTAEIVAPSIAFDPTFNPFTTPAQTKSERRFDTQPSYREKQGIPQNWDTLYQISKHDNEAEQQSTGFGQENTATINEAQIDKTSERQLFQIHNKFILSQIKSGFMLIHQQWAHERVLYERFLQQLESHSGLSQQSLFPETVSLNSSDFELLKELLPDIRNLGFDIREFGPNTVIVEGIPADINHNSEHELLESLLEGFKNNTAILKLDKRDTLARTLARNAATKAGTRLALDEMNLLIDQLFACQMPNQALNGKPIISTFTLNELAERFEK